jgi:MFS transporter, Spinster family, sphingosine-1-phosphate transporter
MTAPATESAEAEPQGRTASNAGKILVLLFLANLLNFFDRVIPAVVAEPIKVEFGLSDTQVGLLASIFTIVYAISGIPLGRAADTKSRRAIMGWGLGVWSALTAVSGLAWSYGSLMLIRMGVGVGEASYAPAANAVIADLYPPHKRSRAVGTFMLGLPLGLTLAFFTVGSIVETFESWRAPFFIAAVPGVVLAFMLGRIKEPQRGASEPGVVVAKPKIPFADAMRAILRIRTMWLLTLAFCVYQIPSYIVNSFAVPLLMRYFGFDLSGAAVGTGVIVGITGLIGLTVGGRFTDLASRKSPRHRVLLGAAMLAIATPITAFAFTIGRGSSMAFILTLSSGWLLTYLFYTAVYPAVADVIEPRLRATAVAIMFAIGYLLGGAGGPVIAGALSDRGAAALAKEAGVDTPTAAMVGDGLHGAMQVLMPIGLAAAAIFLLLASMTIMKDHQAMKDAERPSV